MEIKNNQTNIYFKSFYRNSPPCMEYLSKNFASKSRFKKALQILDERCSNHKYFDIFYIPKNNSITIMSKDFKLKNNSSFKYMTIPQGERYSSKKDTVHISENWPVVDSFIKKLLKIFSFHKAKKFLVTSPYDELPPNVREAVDIVEKMEHSL